jgi:glycosyltransferase involved in cell wall biosynthesis
MTPIHKQRYVLMTPARNEERNIQRLLETVAAQTVTPVRWVIVDDGSTDRTRELVEAYVGTHDFIRLICRAHDGPRTFASKAMALRRAYELLKHEAFDFVGNLDADVGLPPDYYARMLQEFGLAPSLGLAGGLVHDVEGETLIRHNSNVNSVAGAVQLFRREVYDMIGGYQPSAVGGIDTIAEVSTRMHGWTVRTFPDVTVRHHRPMGTASRGVLAASWRRGRMDYRLGYDPVFHLLMCAAHALDRPRLIGSLLRSTSYVCQALRCAPVEAPSDVAAFMRQEQRARLMRGWRPWAHVKRVSP